MQVVFRELRKKNLNPRLRFTNKGAALALEVRLPFSRVIEELEKAGAQILERGAVVSAVLNGVQVNVEGKNAVFVSKEKLSQEARDAIISLAIVLAG